MHTTYRTLQTPEERLVYTVAEAGELLGISLNRVGGVPRRVVSGPSRVPGRPSPANAA